MSTVILFAAVIALIAINYRVTRRIQRLRELYVYTADSWRRFADAQRERHAAKLTAAHAQAAKLKQMLAQEIRENDALRADLERLQNAIAGLPHGSKL